MYLEPCFQKAGKIDFNYMQITRYIRMTYTKLWQLFIQTKPQQVLFKIIQYFQLLTIQMNDQCINHSFYALQTKNMLHTWSDNKVCELAAMAALDKSLSMVWWRWHISVSQLCCCWSMAVCFWVPSITVCVFWCAAARMSELELEQ